MDNPLPHTSSSDAPQDSATGQPTSEVPEAPLQPAGASSGSSQLGGDSAAIPIKRKPGRPKGSGKKSTTAATVSDVAGSAVKSKRPVGRPRKDGLPAGSLKTGSASASRPSRPRKSAPPKMGGVNNKQPLPGASAQGFAVPQPGVRFSVPSNRLIVLTNSGRLLFTLTIHLYPPHIKGPFLHLLECSRPLPRSWHPALITSTQLSTEMTGPSWPEASLTHSCNHC